MREKIHLSLLDIFRIFICGMVFLFHAVVHKFWVIEQDGFFYPNLATGALYMDAFFITLFLSTILYIMIDVGLKYFTRIFKKEG